MADPAFDTLLAALRRTYAAAPVLHDFAPLPGHLPQQPVAPHHIPAATLMESDPGLFATDHAALRDAFIAASPLAAWRETYKGTRLEGDFLDKFGCYCLIGAGGPYAAPDMGAYVVYMPAGLYYPWHHHPAEELYFILAGEAEFLLEGHSPATLGPGDHVFHPSMRPHATETREHPFMALVLWRGDLATKPVLTHPDGTT
jgi:mannose-6-phosphate isomerase-like protein (cupin superfamily)